MVPKSCIKCPNRKTQNSLGSHDSDSSSSTVIIYQSPLQEQFPSIFGYTRSKDWSFSKECMQDTSGNGVVRCRTLNNSSNHPSASSANTVAQEEKDVCTISNNQDDSRGPGGMARMQNCDKKTRIGPALSVQTPDQVISTCSSSSMLPSGSMFTKSNDRNEVDSLLQARAHNNERLEKLGSNQIAEPKKLDGLLPQEGTDDNMDSLETGKETWLVNNSRGSTTDSGNISSDRPRSRLGQSSSALSSSHRFPIQTNPKECAKVALASKWTNGNPSAPISIDRKNGLRLQRDPDCSSTASKTLVEEGIEIPKDTDWSHSRISLQTSNHPNRRSRNDLEDISPDARSFRTVSISSSEAPSTSSFVDSMPSPSENRHSSPISLWEDFPVDRLDDTKQKNQDNNPISSQSLSCRNIQSEENKSTVLDEEGVNELCENDVGRESLINQERQKRLDYFDELSDESLTIPTNTDAIKHSEKSVAEVTSSPQDTFLWNSAPSIAVIQPNDYLFSELRSPTTNIYPQPPRLDYDRWSGAESLSANQVTQAAHCEEDNHLDLWYCLKLSSETPSPSQDPPDSSRLISSRASKSIQGTSPRKTQFENFRSNQSRNISKFEFAILGFPQSILRRVLLELNYRDFVVLRQVSRGLRVGLCDAEAREAILEVFLGHHGYRQMSQDRRRPRSTSDLDSTKRILKKHLNEFQEDKLNSVESKPANSSLRTINRRPQNRNGLIIDLKELDGFHRLSDCPDKLLPDLGRRYLSGELDLSSIRIIHAWGRAHNKLLVRARLQFEDSSNLKLSSQTPEFIPPTLQTTSDESAFHQKVSVFRLWVPSTQNPMSKTDLMKCEVEILKSGIHSFVRCGDIFWNTALEDSGNAGRLIYDGQHLQELQYNLDPIGHLPDWLNMFLFPPSFYHHTITCSDSSPIFYLDMTDFKEQLENGLMFSRGACDENEGVGTKKIYRSTIEITPGTKTGTVERIEKFWAGGFSQEEDEGELIDAEWTGKLMVEIEAENLEGAMEMISENLKKSDPEKFSTRTPSNHWPKALVESHRRSVISRMKAAQLSPWRIVRKKSSPGQIWIRKMYR